MWDGCGRSGLRQDNLLQCGRSPAPRKFLRTHGASRTNAPSPGTFCLSHIAPLTKETHCGATATILAAYFIQENCREEDFPSIATAAVLAMTAVAGAAELSTYEKAGLPVSAVQLQVLGAENVQEATPVATSITPVQLSVLTPRHKITTAQGRTETVGYAIR
jgi:hypothetical protein